MNEHKLGDTVQWSDGWPAPGAKMLQGVYVGTDNHGCALVKSGGKLYEVQFPDLRPVAPEIEFTIPEIMEAFRHGDAVRRLQKTGQRGEDA